MCCFLAHYYLGFCSFHGDEGRRATVALPQGLPIGSFWCGGLQFLESYNISFDLGFRVEVLLIGRACTGIVVGACHSGARHKQACT